MPVAIAIVLCARLCWAESAVQMSRLGGKDPSPAVERLHVELVQVTPLSAAELDTVRDQISRIWDKGGVVVEVLSLSITPPASGHLRVFLTSELIRISAPGSSLCDLGVTRFVDGTPARDLTVSVTAARAFVRQARPEMSPALRSLVAARIIGRVAAHEIGHYLLAETTHRAKGLMRARFDGADLLGSNLQSFAPPHKNDVAAGLARVAAIAER